VYRLFTHVCLAHASCYALGVYYSKHVLQNLYTIITHHVISPPSLSLSLSLSLSIDYVLPLMACGDSLIMSSCCYLHVHPFVYLQTVSILEQRLTMTENKLRECLDNQQRITLQIRPVDWSLAIRHMVSQYYIILVDCCSLPVASCWESVSRLFAHLGNVFAKTLCQFSIHRWHSWRHCRSIGPWLPCPVLVDYVIWCGLTHQYLHWIVNR